ncbi:MAG: hypothetical protein K0U13_01890 [Chlamydiae bacterium]|nr:hypothetical protein [Chlamydiota bacterium]
MQPIDPCTSYIRNLSITAGVIGFALVIIGTAGELNSEGYFGDRKFINRLASLECIAIGTILCIASTMFYCQNNR